MNILRYSTGIFILLLATTGCISGQQEYKTPSAYNLNAPEKFIMPESLMEISGITFRNGNPDTIYSIQDEEGRLFRQGWGVKEQKHSKFFKKGDYEDVTILKDTVIVLKSNGSLYTFPISETYVDEIDSVSEWKQVLPKEEYEGMYGDNTTGNLYVLCKNCSTDKQKDAVTGYILQLTDSMRVTGTFSINVTDIARKHGKVKRGFRPSALARHPLTGDWYIVSSVNKMLVITDGSFQVKEVYELNPALFNQPEGIIFDKNGNLYISNEGDDLSAGNILKFKRKNT
jgi:hypothetical protein